MLVGPDDGIREYFKDMLEGVDYICLLYYALLPALEEPPLHLADL